MSKSTFTRRNILIAIPLLAVPMYLRAAQPLLLHQVEAAGIQGSPQFEVISFAPSSSTSRVSSYRDDSSSFSATNATLGELIEWAYGVKSDRVFGLPASDLAKRYDVALSRPNTDPMPVKAAEVDRRRLMLQDALCTNFGFRSKFEVREVVLYELAQSSRGTTLKPSDPTSTSAVSIANNTLSSQNITANMLAKEIATEIGHTVKNKTQLSGSFAVAITWASKTPKDIALALDQQLGLELVPVNEKTKCLIIERSTSAPVGK